MAHRSLAPGQCTRCGTFLDADRKTCVTLHLSSVDDRAYCSPECYDASVSEMRIEGIVLLESTVLKLHLVTKSRNETLGAAKLTEFGDLYLKMRAGRVQEPVDFTVRPNLRFETYKRNRMRLRIVDTGSRGSEGLTDRNIGLNWRVYELDRPIDMKRTFLTRSNRPLRFTLSGNLAAGRVSTTRRFSKTFQFELLRRGGSDDSELVGTGGRTYYHAQFDAKGTEHHVAFAIIGGRVTHIIVGEIPLAAKTKKKRKGLRKLFGDEYDWRGDDEGLSNEYDSVDDYA